MFNKLRFLFFAFVLNARTFVSSMKDNGGETKESGIVIDYWSETFHEIIYGKSERGANERRVFFCAYPNGTFQ